MFRRGDNGVSTENPDKTGRRTIGNEGGTPEYMAKGGDQGERSGNREVEKLVSITRVSFWGGYIPEEIKRITMILIPKGG